MTPASESAGELTAAVRALFPAGVLARVSPVDAEPRFAHAAEGRAVEGAVAKRRREFATGRRLAHALLGELGLDGGPLLAGPDRAPLWPQGAVGSIAHSAEHVVVAMGRSAEFRALGVDVEPAAPLASRLWPEVLRASERARLGPPSDATGLLALQLFCAKECVYKLLAPEVRRMLDFDEVEVTLEPERGRFRAEVLVRDLAPGVARSVMGRVLLRADCVVTAAALPAPP